MKILFAWTGVTSYMADCWRVLQNLPGVKLKVIVEMADSGKEFAAAKTLQGLDYELIEKDFDDEIRTFTSFSPDVVYAGGWRSRMTRRVLDRYERVPKVFCLDMPWRRSLRCLAARFALRNFVRRFDAVYVPGSSSAFYARWLGFPKDRIYDKLYAVDQSRIRSGEKSASANRTGFLFVGRHSPEKRVDIIERAYARYRAQGGTWSIDYYGQGGRFVQADEMPRVYADHACLLLASSFDPWPLVMLEARSAGLEVIASDRCGNCRELGVFVVPYGDVEAMARRMLDVEHGATTTPRQDLASYDCGAWATRTLAIAREVVAVRPPEPNGMAVVDELLHLNGRIESDEVWVHGMWTPDKWWRCLKAKMTGKKLVRMTHGSLSPIYLKEHGKWKKRLVKPIERLLFALADRVVVTGPWETAWARAWGLKRPLETLDLKQFFALPSEVDVRGWTHRVEADCDLNVLFLARRHPLKGISYLERAVRELSDVDTPGVPRVRLQVVCNLFGPKLEDEWRKCDILCLPTLSENFGLVVADALQRGKRVITTDGAPAWEGQPGVVYLKGFRDGTDEERVRLLKDALSSLR